ncbi:MULTISPECIES: phosphoadenosine phosphosulfate reductase domain-containing protein [Paenibacillus]|uniref:Phosphoadenosine phosphosulfate reductase family protein n=1 Tax=Paenibacillus vandeheii TaxID=3035917 RepID=A0ABT8JFK7_9BACL|nr:MULTISPECIES: phosphoadenosine phosphosulfate reductase family protein [Paenibacillus]KGP81938.1 hypothetical protein P364_0114025 [Paenibacillus sp. MAEPY2]KGP86024.1 hypothetical protein P363_0119500 [Paenibacillus sp. MAEPY1]MDN4603852.1 phosphoadenosine phosphosulfate reductase family protein [Paenibacillus vandeheii]
MEQDTYKFKETVSKIKPVLHLHKHNQQSVQLWRLLKDAGCVYFGTVRKWTSVFQLSNFYVAIHHFINEEPIEELIGKETNVHWSSVLSEPEYHPLAKLIEDLEGNLQTQCCVPEQTFIDAFQKPYSVHLQSPKHKFMLWFRVSSEFSFLLEIFFTTQQIPPYGVNLPNEWPNIRVRHTNEYESQALFDITEYLVDTEPLPKEAMVIQDTIDSQLIAYSQEAVKRIFEENEKVVIAYSGGKDSSVLLQLCVEFVLANPMYQDKLYIISASTGVENPIIEQHIRTMQSVVTNKLDQLFINGFSIDRFTIVEPESDQTYTACVFGDGFIPPSATFKWCVERLKINPGQNDLLERFSNNELVCQVLGVRSAESSNRSKSIEHHFSNDFYGVHVLRGGLRTAPPIRHWTAADVATYLVRTPAPWNEEYSNHNLINIYGLASGMMECPIGAIIQNENDAVKGCSGSSARFGCWACTVVKEDKSLSNLVDAYPEELGPHYKMRRLLKGVQEIRYGGCTGYYRNRGGFSTGYGDLTIDIRTILLTFWREYNLPLSQIEVVEIIKKVKARELPEGLAISHRFWEIIHRFFPHDPGPFSSAMFHATWEPRFLIDENNNKVKLETVGVDRVSHGDIAWAERYQAVCMAARSIQPEDDIQMVVKGMMIAGKAVQVLYTKSRPQSVILNLPQGHTEIKIPLISEIYVIPKSNFYQDSWNF